MRACLLHQPPPSERCAKANNICFGIEVDVRSYSLAAAQTTASPPLLVLSHDACPAADEETPPQTSSSDTAGLPFFVYNVDAPSSSDDKTVPASQSPAQHLRLWDLISLLGAFAEAVKAEQTQIQKGPRPSHSFTCILKLDVKDVVALPHVLDLLETLKVSEAALQDGALTSSSPATRIMIGIPPPSSRLSSLSKRTEASTAGTTASSALILHPSQVWFNMDVVPLVPSPPITASSSALPPTFDPFILDQFRRAVGPSLGGLGLSLGFKIDSSVLSIVQRELAEIAAAAAAGESGDVKSCIGEKPPLAPMTQAMLARAHDDMLAFVKAVYVGGNGGLAKRGSEAPLVLTFALNFALFLHNPTTLALIKDLCEKCCQAVAWEKDDNALPPSYSSPSPSLPSLSSSPLFIFPTYWRARDAAITPIVRQALMDECRQYVGGRTCSVDTE